MAPVNVAECDVEAGVSQQANVTVLTKKIDDSQFLNTSFLDLPFEVQCHIFRQISAAEIRELKAVSKDLKRLIEKNWTPAFYILPPNVQIRILNDTQMTSSEIRRLKLVSKDMRYLIERGGRHLTKQELTRCRIVEIAPGSFKVVELTNCFCENISLEHFSRVFAHCHIFCLHLHRLNVTFDFCDQMHSFFRKNKITVGNLALIRCNFNNKEKVTIIDRLLRTTEASRLTISSFIHKKNRFNKAFFGMSSVRKLEELSIFGRCHFFYADLSAGNYRKLSVRKCRLTEHCLRRILEEVLDCRREIVSYLFKIRKRIDVDRLLDGLPDIERIDEHRWNLRNSRGQIMELRIVKCFFRCQARTI